MNMTTPLTSSQKNGRPEVPVIAVVGDYSPEIMAHRAIPRALELACAAHSIAVAWEWVGTATICEVAREFAGFAAVWVVPASPYENMAGALEAIRWARETKRPFLGTCGGFQHAIIEFARNVSGLTAADHAETRPAGETLVVTPLSCSMVGKTGRIHFAAGSRLREIYGGDSVLEE
jgi:CTP synthase (UTP-ammonia lyase)